MEEGRQLNSHRPFHIYYGHTYFVSGRCYDGNKLFKNDDYKKVFVFVLEEARKRFGIKLYSWVILENHYHLLFSLPYSEIRIDEMSLATNFVCPSETDFVAKTQSVNPNCPKYCLIEFIRKIHKDSSRIINKIDHTPSRRVWYQYWDYCIRNIPDFWMHFNYIIQNPLKHGLVKNLYSAYHYEFSSSPIWLKRFTADGLWESFVKYPVKDWTPSDCE